MVTAATGAWPPASRAPARPLRLSLPAWVLSLVRSHACCAIRCVSHNDAQGTHWPDTCLCRTGGWLYGQDGGLEYKKTNRFHLPIWTISSQPGRIFPRSSERCHVGSCVCSQRPDTGTPPMRCLPASLHQRRRHRRQPTRPTPVCEAGTASRNQPCPSPLTSHPLPPWPPRAVNISFATMSCTEMPADQVP